ncbi:hypothetical protein COCON_G00064150 [Conger conger]|uniref:Uncharacterized protein n=1 Tax=Conger conger TaxID=82655 RepID=A0A9Q1I321_CONCO|nr:hypothetical protein COCON_G00064150 [Conger conger]
METLSSSGIKNTATSTSMDDCVSPQFLCPFRRFVDSTEQSDYNKQIESECILDSSDPEEEDWQFGEPFKTARFIRERGLCWTLPWIFCHLLQGRKHRAD